MNTHEVAVAPMLPALSRLIVYRRALALAARVHELNVGGSLGDQMRGAVHSVVLNLAEGASAATRANKRRYFPMSRASTWELGATLDLAAIADRRIASGNLADEVTTVERILAALALG